MSRDDEQVWAELVESFHSSPDDTARQWPAAENLDPERSNTSDDEPDEPREAAEKSHSDALESAATHRARAHEPEEHFVPPTPPPLPSTDLITRAAWASVLGVPIFLTVVVLLGRSVSGWLGAACAGAFVGGFAVLVARLRGHDPYDPDDGAVV
ncbi:MAG TPA: hypothetical protein VFR23_20955 [Jiangellaceae bacterium]|nr:hypothetical protein [Jiangellaceae bacterium]